jgi:hypothetical protein
MIGCLHRPRYKLTCSSRQSVGPRITSNLYSFSDHTDFSRIPKYHSSMYLIVASVTMSIITLLDDNEAKPPIIVAYLRKPHICNNIIYYSEPFVRTVLVVRFSEPNKLTIIYNNGLQSSLMTHFYVSKNKYNAPQYIFLFVSLYS